MLLAGQTMSSGRMGAANREKTGAKGGGRGPRDSAILTGWKLPNHLEVAEIKDGIRNNCLKHYFCVEGCEEDAETFVRCGLICLSGRQLGN